MYTQITTTIFIFFYNIIMEYPTSNKNINAIKEVRRTFNELRSNFSSNETKRIRRKLHKKEAASMFFKDKEQDGTLTNRQKNVMKNIPTMLNK